MYTIDQVMSIVYANESKVVLLAFATYAFGFIQYFSSMYMQVKHRQCPFYFWMHCWYFGHDLTFSLLFYQWFHDINFWLFKVLCIGCMCFVGIEIFSLYYTVKYERSDAWGKYHSNRSVSEKEGWIRGICGYIAGFLLFQVIRIAIGDPMCLVLMMSTNATLAIASQFRLEEVGRQKKGIHVLAWFTVLGTILTFSPRGIGFFATCVEALNAPWFFTLGAFAILCSIRFLILSYRLPQNNVSSEVL